MSTPATAETTQPADGLEVSPRRKYLAALSVGALGVVYGDIGTSPIYSMREAFHAQHQSAPVKEDVLGVVSLIFWALVIIICIKYIIFVLRADHHGQGGILALTTVVNKKMPRHRRDLPLLMILGLFGTSLLFGDGMLTPSISVLSAVEGLKTATPFFEPYVIPITVTILVGLFLIQKRGTEKVGKLFGPVVLLWFLTLTVLGLSQIVRAPEVLWAVLPQYGIQHLLHMGWTGFAMLGSVFLAVTGGEAMYADLGHFGARPIRLAWFAVAFPALLASYFGQGALLLQRPEAVSNPFFLMVPGWAIYPMVLLTTAATVIASQALISGTYSLTMQAVQLKYLPRMRVEHTSEHEIGQIYVPFINWILMVACVLLVVTFRTSSNIAAAYGVAVTLDMIITTTLLYFMLRHGFGWSWWRAGGLCAFFGSIELVFFAGNAVKIPHGGWFPLVVGGVMFLLMSTWRLGRKRIAAIRSERGIPLETLIRSIPAELARVPGTAVFMHPEPDRIPPALLHNIEHNQVLHATNLIVAVTILDQPYVPRQEIATVKDLGSSFHRVHLRFGYMDRPDVPAVLRELQIGGEPLESSIRSYFLSRETILSRDWLWSGMATWRERLFALMSRNAEDATAYFCIPPARVMEVGTQLEI
ncbi:MAG: potassium transporter Kup [Armatimonadetes bacterium]|nr:potassium transporter Kup [Armatimonadota bacterium]